MIRRKVPGSKRSRQEEVRKKVEKTIAWDVSLRLEGRSVMDTQRM